MNSYLRDPQEDKFGKSLVNPERVKSVYNHGPMSTLDGKFYDVIVNKELGKMFHYRDSTQGEKDRQKSIRKVIS